jgi:menaquinone-9 beta-reductase
VLDRARFPRDKVCAGWITPEVFPLLEFSPEHYRAAGLTLHEIRAFRTGLLGRPLIETRYPRVVSYAVRRCEFDTFLLRRTGARVLDGTSLATLRRRADAWVINDMIQAPVVIGAGGHFCPVARYLRGADDERQPVVAKEAEARMDACGATGLPDAPELFFCRDLQGYGWCVRKGDYVNVGIGRRGSRDFAAHLRGFTDFLEHTGRLGQPSRLRWQGHAYFASGSGLRPIVSDGALLVGDAAGFAYPESGEGIKPAIESGRLAAETLVSSAGRWDRSALAPYAEAMHRRHPHCADYSAPVRAGLAAAGRVLLGSRAFTRRVVLDKWFLRR